MLYGFGIIILLAVPHIIAPILKGMEVIPMGYIASIPIPRPCPRIPEGGNDVFPSTPTNAAISLGGGKFEGG